MDIQEFISKVIERGKVAAKRDYTDAKDKDRLDGSLAGFEACRGLDEEGVLDLFRTANKYKNEAWRDQVDNYWYFVCYALEVEWVLNCISAKNKIEGKPPLLYYHPTVNAMSVTVRILDSP